MLVAAIGGITASLGGLKVIDLGWPIFPIALATIIAAAIVVTTPSDSEVDQL